MTEQEVFKKYEKLISGVNAVNRNISSIYIIRTDTTDYLINSEASSNFILDKFKEHGINALKIEQAGLYIISGPKGRFYK